MVHYYKHKQNKQIANLLIISKLAYIYYQGYGIGHISQILKSTLAPVLYFTF